MPNLLRPLPRMVVLGASTLLLALGAGEVGRGVATSYAAGGSSLRFYGTGDDELDRVRIPLGPVSDGRIGASYPVNVAGDFTVEFWMKAAAAENTAPACENGWYYGNIIVDRDVDGAGDHGDYGLALCAGRLAAGVSVGDDDRQLVSDVVVADGQWHHVALTRVDGGPIALFVDGRPAASAAGPAGSVAYRANRETSQPASDPYLVLGAEKHLYPDSHHYAGSLDDLRISSVARYSGAFARPDAPHPADTSTVALYRFDEGAGTVAADSSGAAGGPSDGLLVVAGDPQSPAWSADTPFAPVAEPPPPAEPSAAPEPAPASSPTPAPGPEAAPTGPALEATPAPPPAESSATALPAVVMVPTLERPSATPLPPTAAPTAPAPATAGGAAAADPTVAVTTAVAHAAAEAPPPTGSFYPLLLAWLAAAAAIAVAVVVVVRRRARG